MDGTGLAALDPLALAEDDADIVLGYLDGAALLDGGLRIDRAAAERAVADHVAAPLGLGVAEAAARIVEVVNANMCEALRIVSVERGHDPGEFSLMAFGGAGPVRRPGRRRRRGTARRRAAPRGPRSGRARTA